MLHALRTYESVLYVHSIVQRGMKLKVVLIISTWVVELMEHGTKILHLVTVSTIKESETCSKPTANNWQVASLKFDSSSVFVVNLIHTITSGNVLTKLFGWLRSGFCCIIHCILLPCFLLAISRSSRPEVFCKKGVLRNFAQLTGKILYRRLFFNKVAGLGLQLY